MLVMSAKIFERHSFDEKRSGGAMSTILLSVWLNKIVLLKKGLTVYLKF
jgi:hypothetical protein